MKKIIKYFALSLLLILGSCYGDKDNNFYELSNTKFEGAVFKVNGTEKTDADTSMIYRKVDGVYTFNKNTIIVDADDQIDIALNLKFDAGFTPTYRWSMMEVDPLKDLVTDEYPEAIELGDTKDLSFIIKGAPVLFYVVCNITNVETGVEDYIAFMIKINKPNGLAILYEGPNGGDFDFMKSVNNTLNWKKDEYYKNVYSSVNASYIEKPNNIYFSPAIPYGPAASLTVISDDSFTSLNTNTYKVSNVDQSKFFSVAVPTYSQFSMVAHSASTGSNIYAVFDDEVFFGSGMVFNYSLDSKNSYQNMVIQNEGSTVSDAYFVLFDKTNKAFKYGRNKAISKFVSMEESEFNLDDTKMDLIYGESGNDKNVNAVMKDGSSIFFCVIDMKLRLDPPKDKPELKQDKASVLSKKEVTSLTGLTATSLWAMNARNPKAYYSAGSKVYLYNQDLNTSTEFATVQGNITLLKVFKHANETLNSKTLYVGTDANKLYEFSFDVISGVVVGNPVVYDLDGKPISVNYI